MRFTHHRANHKLIWYTGLDEVAASTSPAQVKLVPSFDQDAPDDRDFKLLGPFVAGARLRIGSGNFDTNVEDYL